MEWSPVPLYPPTSMKRIEHYLNNLANTLRVADLAALVVLPEVRGMLALVEGESPGGGSALARCRAARAG